MFSLNMQCHIIIIRLTIDSGKQSHPEWCAMLVELQPIVIIGDSKSLYPAILDSTAFMFLYHSNSDCLNVAALVIFPKWCRSQDLEIPQDHSDGEGERRWGALFSGGRTCFLCLVHAAQGCWRRRSETKHDASEAVGPSSEAKEKRVESLREREGEEENYASIGLHWIRQSPNSSGFSLRCKRVNGLEISEAAPVRTRTDISILSAFFFGPSITSHTYKMAMLSNALVG